MIRTGTPHWRSDLGREVAAVARLAHRRRRDDRQMIDAERSRQRDEALQIGKGKLDAVAVEAAGRRDAAPEAAHDFLVEQRQQGCAEAFEDDKTQRIGADVDDGDATDGAEVAGEVAIGHCVSGRRQPGTAVSAACRRVARRSALPRPDRLGLVMK